MLQIPTQLLPYPSDSIPFHVQANPIPDPLQVHVGPPQRNVVNQEYDTPNNLVHGRFLGTDWTQPNQPKFLGANERIIFKPAW